MQNFKSIFLWGFVLWLIGYILGILLFPIVSNSMIGWIIMPIGTLIAIWVLIKKIHLESFNDYLLLGLVWVLIAIILDYFLLVKLFNPADGYYKLDVYIYYVLTFLLPILVGYFKRIK